MKLEFGQPVPVLYDEDIKVRMSYPDLIEDDGEYYLSETQKTVARVHKIDKNLIEGLWQNLCKGEGWSESKETLSTKDENSFSIRFETAEEIGTLFAADTFNIERLSSGEIVIKVTDAENTMIFVNDDELLCDGKNHTVTAVFDAGVSAVYFVTDGRFCDGGEKRQFGFTRFKRGSEIVFYPKNVKVNNLLNLRFRRGIHLYD